MAQVCFDTGHHGRIQDAQPDYYGKLVASASADHCVRIWNVSGSAPEFVTELRGHEGPVTQVSWSHPKYGNLLATASQDKRVAIWKEQQPGSWSLVYMSEDHTSSVNAVSFAPCEYGLHLAAGSTDGTISILSYNCDAHVWSRKAFMAHPNGVLSVDWCAPCASSSLGTLPQGCSASGGVRRLVSGGNDRQVRIWTFVEASNEWAMAHQFSDNRHTGPVKDVAWRPAGSVTSGNFVASCSLDHTIRLWQEADNVPWKCKQVIDLGAPVWKISWSITGSVLSAISGTNKVTLYKENFQGLWEPF